MKKRHHSIEIYRARRRGAEWGEVIHVVEYCQIFAVLQDRLS